MIRLKEPFQVAEQQEQIQSQHFVTELHIYEESFIRGFEYFYGRLKIIPYWRCFPVILERARFILDLYG